MNEVLAFYKAVSPDNIVTVLLSLAIVHLWRRDSEAKKEYKENMDAITRDRDACEERYKSLENKVWELTMILIKNKRPQDLAETTEKEP